MKFDFFFTNYIFVIFFKEMQLTFFNFTWEMFNG